MAVPTLTRPIRTIRISQKDRLLFSKRLSLYLRAGISILDAIQLISVTPGSHSHGRLLKSILQDIQEGQSLSASLSKYPKAYSENQIAFISIGERSGSLSRSLNNLAITLEERSARTRSFMNALAYPTILAIGSIVVSLFLLVYAFPKIVPLFKGLHAKLPLTTRIIIALSSFLQHDWVWLLAGLGGIGVSLYLASYSPRVTHSWHYLTLRIPYIGNVIRAALLSQIFSSVSILLASGLRLDEALLMARNALANSTYRASLEHIRRSVLSGNKFSASVELEGSLFPLVSLQLISVGEMTGTLAESTESISLIFKEELTERLNLLTSLLEPLIMVTMGLVIGCIAMAIISPMYGITQSLSV